VGGSGGCLEPTPAANASSFEIVNAELRTERLVMRPPEEADVDTLLALHDDPAMLRMFGETNREEVAEWVAQARGDWAEKEYGRVLIFDRAGGAFLGRGGLRHRPEFDEIDIAWSLAAAARGRGLATESARAWIDWGFRELDAPYLTAMINHWNAASMAVAERLGMTPLREDVLHGSPVVVYAISRDA
jgi:RimJ/RimL family protein N-acetyltransferase